VSWKEFVASIIGSLVWPTMIVMLVVILRRPIVRLIPLLQRVKYKDLELDFGKQARELGDEVATELPPLRSTERSDVRNSVAERIAGESPRAAVIEAWREVELAALSAARRLGGDTVTGKSLSYQAIRYLENSDELDRGVVSLLRDLRGLRNQAAHAPEFAISTESALDYAAAAAQVAEYLDAVGGVPDKPAQPAASGRR
jgi:hypothetical protein